MNSPFVTVLATALAGGGVITYLVRLRERVAAEQRDEFETKRLLQLDISRAMGDYVGAALTYYQRCLESPQYEGIMNRIRWVLRRPGTIPPGLMRHRLEAAGAAWEKAFRDWCVHRQEIAVRLRLRFSSTGLPDQWETLADEISDLADRWEEATEAGETPEYADDLNRVGQQTTSFLAVILQHPLSSAVGKRPRPFPLKLW